MNNNSIFYGTDEPRCITYLEFGEIDHISSIKNVWGFKLHQKAYDWFMLARYSNDIVAIKKMKQLIKSNEYQNCKTVFTDEIHHKNELNLALGKLAALVATCNGREGSFFELGQTLFGCIDSMDLCLDIFKGIDNRFDVNLKTIKWIGLDISDTFNELSKLLHSDYKVITSKTSNDLPCKWSVFYSKGITLLYVIRDLQQLYEYINASDCAFFDYSFSIDKDFNTNIGTGKEVKYIDIKQFLTSYPSEIEEKVLYVNKRTSKVIFEKNQIWLECIVADENVIGKFLKIENDIFKNLETLDKMNITNSNIFDKDYHNGWITLDEFLKANIII